MRMMIDNRLPNATMRYRLRKKINVGRPETRWYKMVGSTLRFPLNLSSTEEEE
jgi:hypothetical protein